MGLRDIYQSMEDEYLEKLEQYGNGFCVDEGGEYEEYFDTFEEAKDYAIKHNIDQVKAEPFGYCWGAYCDGEYEEYNGAILDLDMNVIEYVED